MKPLSTIVIDDEKQAREGVKNLLENDPEIEIVEICKDGLKAIEAIDKLKPQLIFLDIQMPGINGFEVLNSILSELPAVVFVTAHDRFALKAFEVHAIDYLLKPFTNQRFYEALNKAKQSALNRNWEHQKDQLTQLLSSINQLSQRENKFIPAHPPYEQKLIIRDSGKVIFLNPNEVIRLEANDYYIKVHTQTKSYLVRESLKNMEKRLNGFSFLRIHRSHIINTRKISQILNCGNAEFEFLLEDQTRLLSGRSYKDAVRALLP